MLADRRKPKRKPGAVMQHAGMLVVPAPAVSLTMLDDNRDFVSNAHEVEFVELPDDERF